MPKKAVKKTPRRPSISVLTEEMKTFIHLAMKDGEQKAAAMLHLSAAEVKGMLRLKPVSDYLKQYRHAFLKQMAAYEVGRITRYPVTREDVIGRYWALANMPPEETRGNIDGQKTALDGIAEILGMKFSPRDADSFFRDKTPEQLKNYAIYGKFEPSDEEKAPGPDARKPDDTKRD